MGNKNQFPQPMMTRDQSRPWLKQRPGSAIPEERNRVWRSGLALALTAAALFVGAGCTRTLAPSEVAPAEIQMSKLDVNLYPINKMVCDPMGPGQPDPRSNLGLKAELFWREANQPRTYKAADMIRTGKRSDRSLFFSQLNVPTRLFHQGFLSPTGQAIQDDAKNTLIEFFGLRFKSILRLAPEQPEGLYEFALLSDDGAVLQLRNSEGLYESHINNDGDHPTRLACGAHPVNLTAATELPMVLEYYQGPRFHISLIMLMRKWNPDRKDLVKGRDTACGLTGNSTWFNPDKNSTPQKAYKDLLARGWTPLSHENFALPNEAVMNPCKEGVVPKIAGFNVLEKFNDGFMLTWTTDIPATSQVAWRGVDGSEGLSESDNVLRTQHTVMLKGLKAKSLYELRAVSISDTYGKGISLPITATTDL
jgi:hypothetical protein